MRNGGVFGSSGSPGGSEAPDHKAWESSRGKRRGAYGGSRKGSYGSGSRAGSGGGRGARGAEGADGSKAPGKAEKKLGPQECRAKMLQLLAMRDYSTHAMAEKLAKAGFADKDVKAAVDMAVKSRLMDDTRYALAYISYKKEAGWGRAKIEQELGKQGIVCEGLPGYPEALFDEDEELARAQKLLASHRTTAKDPRASHYRYLLSKGFSPSVASRALRSL